MALHIRPHRHYSAAFFDHKHTCTHAHHRRLAWKDVRARSATFTRTAGHQRAEKALVLAEQITTSGNRLHGNSLNPFERTLLQLWGSPKIKSISSRHQSWSGANITIRSWAKGIDGGWLGRPWAKIGFRNAGTKNSRYENRINMRLVSWGCSLCTLTLCRRPKSIARHYKPASDMSDDVTAVSLLLDGYELAETQEGS